MQDHETLALEWALLNDPDLSPARIEAIMLELDRPTLRRLIRLVKKSRRLDPRSAPGEDKR